MRPAEGAVHLDPSLVIGDGLVHERETEAEAAAVSGGLATGEALEEPPSVRRVESDTRVGHPDGEHLRSAVGPDGSP